ncbi:MAG: HAD family hydrolase [Tissierellia bacterium]|nr:HAD family hydrolase [Tissierellia bacterium]
MKIKEEKNKGTHGFPCLVEGVVFDLDGTLMNTLDQIAGVANSVLEDLAYAPLPQEDYKMLLGNGSKALLESLFDRRGIRDPKAREVFSRVYMDRYAQSEIGREAVYPGIYELIEGLKERGIPLGVLTNKPHGISLKLLGQVFPGIFKAIQGQEEGLPRKPHPAGLEVLAQAMGFSPGTCLYLGDTNTDMMTAKAYGAYTVGVLWGFRDQEELEEAGADLVIAHPLDLFKYLDQ